MDRGVTETVMDAIKTGTALAPPGASLFFGITLEEWMFIASIVASVFIVLDKLPSIMERISEKFKKQSSRRSTSDTDVHPPD